jgi:hypothetical protein
VGGRIGPWRQHHRQHPQAVLAREFEVALVLARAAEDGAGAVLHEHEVGDPHRELRAFDERVPHAQPGVEAALLRLLDRRFAGAHAAALGDELRRARVALRRGGRERVLRRDREEAHAEQRVRAAW